MNKWDEEEKVKVGKEDLLIQALEYAIKNGVDTVEMQVTFHNNQAFIAEITFRPVDGKDEENEDE